MSIFTTAKPEMAFVKLGIYGRAGSGKTHTSAKFAIGLHKYIKSDKPVAMLDTETGSDFLIPMFAKAGVPFVTAKSRSFAKLVEAVDEAEREASIFIIDSITHFWYEIVASYMRKLDIKRMTFNHWGPVKEMWREFSDRYVNSKLHIVMCGRAGDVWEDVADEEGVLESKRVGTKMKAEVETGYEPSLLIEMVKEHQSAKKKGSPWTHRAYVMKDRFDVIDGRAFDDPGFEEFLPHVELLSIGGEHHALDTGDNSERLFERGDMGAKRAEKKNILLEKIQNEIYLLYPSQSAEDKKARLNLMKKIFGTHAWAEITATPYRDMPVLEDGLKKLEGMRADEQGIGTQGKE